MSMRKLLIFAPLLCLIGAVIIAYFYLPLSWFLVATGLLAMAFILLSEKSPKEGTPPSQAVQPGAERLAEVLGDAAFIYDSGFKIVAWNAGAEKLFHIPREEVLGNVVGPKDAGKPSWERLVQVVFPSLAPEITPRSKEGEFPQVTDLSFKDPELELRITASKLVLDSATGAAGFLKIVQDRTREAAALREKNDFVTVASHQLRTPVTSIIWATEALLRSENLQGEEKEFVQNAYDSAKKLSTIVEDLLSISRIEEGRFGYNFAPMDIVEFLTKTLQAALPQARRLGIKMFFDRPQAPLPQVYADADKLNMALGNILDNAVRYNVKDGEVTVRVKQGEGSFVEVDVRDTGIGIPREEVSRLFKKFYRASNALKFETQGSGLGLYIAQGIIQSHGGKISVESEVDHGTVISFTLPTDPSLIPPKEMPLQ
jgi:signal transduction histidine kinase